MAKKEKFDVDNDDYGLGDDDWGDDPFNPVEDKSPGNRTPVVSAGRSMLRGAKDVTKDPSFYRKVLQATLPDSFSVTLDNVDQLTDISRRTYQTALKDAKPLMKEVQRLAGAINRSVPSPFQKKINDYLSSKDKRDSVNGEYDAEEASVAQGLGSLLEQQAQEDRQEEKAERVMETVMSNDYRKNVTSQLAAINRNLTIQTENALKFQRGWQRKTLEIQIRQLFVSRKTLEITKQGMEENSVLLRDVVKNTALPEIQKEHKSETVQRLMRERIFGAAQGRVAEWSRPYFRNVGNRITKKLRDRTTSALYSFQQSADMFESIEEQMKAMKEMGIDPNDMAAEMAGGSIATKIGEYLGKKLGSKMDLQKADNFFRTINYRKDILPQLLAGWGRRTASENYGTLKGALGEALNVPFQRDTVIREGALQSIGNDSGKMNYQDRVLRSLEETLPGFLSRLLLSQEQQRTGNANQKRIIFDNQKGVFTTLTDSNRRLHENILSSSAIDSSQEQLKNLIGDVGKGLSKKEKMELGKFLNEKGKDHNFAWSPEMLLAENSGLSNSIRKKLTRNMRGRYGLVDDGKGGMKLPGWGASGIKALQGDSKAFNNYRDYSTDAYNKIKAFSSLGNIEQLQAIGAVKWNESTQTWEMDPDYVEKRSNEKFRRKTRNQNPFPPPLDDYSDDLGPANDGPRPTPGPAPIEEEEEKGGRLRNLFRRGEQRSITRAINDQTERLLDAFENLPVRDVQEEQTDYLSDILEKLHAGIDTHGTGGEGGGTRRKGLLRRGLGLARRGVRAAWNAGSYPYKAMKWLGNKTLWQPSKWLGGKVFGKLKNFGRNRYDAASRFVTDIYVRGEEGLRRAIDRALLEAGQYVDMNTGKVIKSLKDITGPVMNATTQKLVITQEEFDAGLLDSLGKRIKDGIFGRAKRATGRLLSLMAMPVTKPLAWIKSGLGLAKKFAMTPPDVYLASDLTKPVMYGEQMYNGMYWSSTTNKVVRNLGDIDGDIFTWDRETMQKRIVLTTQQIQSPGITDYRGKPLKGFLKKWKDRLVGAKNFLMDNLNPMKWFKKGKDVLMGGLRSVRDFFKGGGSEDGGFRRTSWTKRIYRLLYNKFTGLPLDQGLENVAGELGSKLATSARRLGGWLRGKLPKLDGLSGLFSKVPGIKDLLLKAFGNKRKSLKDRIDEERNREGSWVNRLANKASAVKSGFTDLKEKAKKFSWLPVIMTGFGAVGAAIKGFKDSFMKWGGTLLKKVPDILKAIRDSKLMGSALDALGGGGGGRRGRGGLLRRGASWLGRTAWDTVRHPIKTAGKLLRGGGSALRILGGGALRALPYAAGLVATIVTSPITWIAAAAAGVGYLIYKGYKAYKGRITSIREMRLAQYGFTKDDSSDHTGKVLALEEACMKVLKFDANGTPSLGALDYKELLTAFEIPPTAEKSVLAWARWFSNRFRPVFLKNIQELRRLDPKASLLEAHTTLPKGLLPKYAMATRLPDMLPNGEKGPYFIEDSPFPNESCTIGTRLVDSTIQAVVKEFSNEAKAYRETKRAELNLGNVEKAAYAPLAGNRMKEGFQLKSTDNFYSPGDVDAKVGTITGDVDKDMKIIKNSMIDDLTAIRMKVYGLREMSKSQVNIIYHLEEDMLRNNIEFREIQAVFKGNSRDIAQQWAPAFGISIGSSTDMADWTFWFEKRFLPAYLNFITRSVKYCQLAEVLTKTRGLKAEAQLAIAEFMSGAKTSIDGKTVSVWAINAYPFPMESANTDTLIIEGNIKALKQRIKDDVYQEELSKRDPRFKVDPSGRTLNDEAYRNRMKQMPGGSVPDQARRAFDLANLSSGTILGRDGGLSEYDMSRYAGVADKTALGGDAKGLPPIDREKLIALRSRDSRVQYMMPFLKAVSDAIGVDVAALVAFGIQESDFDPMAGAGTSSAKGVMQFIDSTWKGYVPKLQAFGFSNPDVNDPAANIVAGAMFLKDNQTYLKNKLGRSPNIPELYLAHFLGPAGASAVLNASGDTKLSQVVAPESIAANKTVLGGGRTVADLKKWATEKAMSKGLVYAAKYAGAAAIPNEAGGGSSTASVEAGSIVNSNQMGTSSTGSMPNQPAPAPVTNASVLTGPLPEGPTNRQNTKTDPPAPVALPQNVSSGIKQQQAREMQAADENARSQRVQQVNQQTRNRDVAEKVANAEQATQIQIDIRQGIWDIKELIEGVISGKGGNGTSSPSPSNKEAMLTNALGNVPIPGRKSGAPPFNVSISK